MPISPLVRRASVACCATRASHAISLDLIRNGDGRRLVENLRSVAWNGIAASFSALERTWPQLGGPRHSTVKVLIMGAGRVGRHAVEFATKYGDDGRNEALTRAGLPGVEVVTAGRNLTGDPEYLKARLLMTDLLVDATARRDPSTPIIPNAWLALLPKHAVICDLAVDPYLLDVEPPIVRGVEGIPQGNLDQWEFAPDDPAWDNLPPGVPTGERRTVVSCYSWPGVRPEPCMHVYGSQLAPLLEALVTAGGLDGINPTGKFHEQALWRGSLRGWIASGEAAAHAEPGLSTTIGAVTIPLPPPVSGFPFGIETAAGRVAAYELGKGRTVLLLHSFNAAGSGVELAPLATRLAKTRRVVLVDWLGFGTSERPDAAYDAQLYGEQLELIRTAALQEGETSVDVVALSLPGQYVVVAAAEHPERYGRIVLISPTGFGRFKGSAGEGTRKVYRFLRVTGIGRLLFAILARRQVIHRFIAQIFADPQRIPADYERYCWRTCQQAGAFRAPLAFRLRPPQRSPRRGRLPALDQRDAARIRRQAALH